MTDRIRSAVKLGEHRAHLGLSYARLGERWGFDAAQLCRWETGASRPNPDNAARVEALSWGYVDALGWGLKVRAKE